MFKNGLRFYKHKQVVEVRVIDKQVTELGIQHTVLFPDKVLTIRKFKNKPNKTLH